MTTQLAQSSQDRLITIDEVQSRVSLSRATLWRLRKRRAFPEPVPASPGRKLWSEQAVNVWMEDLLNRANPAALNKTPGGQPGLLKSQS